MKKIVVHIDDAGLSKSTNEAIFDLHENGLEFSTSLMPVTKGFEEYVSKYKLNYGKKIDTGLHLTLTSEWEEEKTSPISDVNSVESLVDENGNFHSNIKNVLENANIEHIQKEINNQVMYLLDNGVDITHIDSHMGVLLHKDLIKYYLELAQKYKIKPFLKYPSNPYDEKTYIGDWFGGCGREIDKYIEKGHKVFDGMDPYSLGKDEYYNSGVNGFNREFISRLRKLPVGINYFIFHIINSKGDDFIFDREKRYIEYLFLRNSIKKTLLENNVGSLRMKDFI